MKQLNEVGVKEERIIGKFIAWKPTLGGNFFLWFEAEDCYYRYRGKAHDMWYGMHNWFHIGQEVVFDVKIQDTNRRQGTFSLNTKAPGRNWNDKGLTIPKGKPIKKINYPSFVMAFPIKIN